MCVSAAEARTLSYVVVVIRVSRYVFMTTPASHFIVPLFRSVIEREALAVGVPLPGPQCVDHVLVCTVGYPSQITAFAPPPSTFRLSPCAPNRVEMGTSLS